MTNQDTSRIHQRIAELVRDLHGRLGSDRESVVQEVVDSALLEVPGAQYAGITVTASGHAETAAATHRVPVLLDKLQQEYGQGPCLEASRDHHTVRVNDLRTETRWPAYCRVAVAETPVRSMLSFQMFTARKSMGALNIFAETPDAFSAEAEEIGLVFAAHAALAWDSVRREDEFRSALTTRDIIGQAKGILMERYQIDAVKAFDLLKRLSQESNTRLAEIARKLVTLGDENTAE